MWVGGGFVCGGRGLAFITAPKAGFCIAPSVDSQSNGFQWTGQYEERVPFLKKYREIVEDCVKPRFQDTVVCVFGGENRTLCWGIM